MSSVAVSTSLAMSELDETLSVVHATQLQGNDCSSVSPDPGHTSVHRVSERLRGFDDEPLRPQSACSPRACNDAGDMPPAVIRDAKRVMRSIRRLIAAELNTKVSRRGTGCCKCRLFFQTGCAPLQVYQYLPEGQAVATQWLHAEPG